MSKLLRELINATLTGKPLEEEGVKEEDWQECFDLALQQQVLAMTFPTMSALPKEERPSFTLWSKWMAFAESTAEKSCHQQEVVRKMGAWLAEDGLSTLVVKGFSVAALYPKPNLREFCDVDIYSGSNYEAVNDCLARHGQTIGHADGHHARVTIDGVAVEHHFSFCNSRVKDDVYRLEESLRRLAEIGCRAMAMPGIEFPNPVFTALYVGWHAYKHFMHEKIELRHVVDWALALKQLTAAESNMLNEVSGNAPWGRFFDTMTAISLRRIGLPEDWFPQCELERAESIAAADEQRVWNDIVVASHMENGRTMNHRRLIIARRLMQNRWKFDAYAEESARKFLWKEFVGYVKGEVTRKSHITQR